MKLSTLKMGIIDIPTVMLLHLDRLGNISNINKKGCKILGYARKEIIGMNWFDHFIKKEMQREIKDVFFQIISGKSELVEHYENRVITKSGKVKMIAFHNAIIYNDDGRVVGVFSSGHDITEQKKLTRRLEESEKMLKNIVESAQDGLLIADMETKRFKFANKKICSMLGYSKEELLNLSVFDIHPEDALEEAVKEFALLAKKEIDLAKAIPVKRKDGSLFCADISGGNLTIYGKRCLLGIFRGIDNGRTERSVGEVFPRDIKESQHISDDKEDRKELHKERKTVRLLS